MANTIKEFDSVSITNASVQFYDDGEQQEGTKFGCVGQLETETELIEISKKCEGIEVKKITKPMKSDNTISAHVPINVFRDFFGLTNKGLKEGVYSYGTQSKGKRFVFTADVVDEFEDIVKMIAFANCTSATGLKFTIENGADEVALLELEYTSLPNEEKQIYYETLIPELDEADKEEIIEEWHKNFTPALVEVATP